MKTLPAITYGEKTGAFQPGAFFSSPERKLPPGPSPAQPRTVTVTGALIWPKGTFP